MENNQKITLSPSAKLALKIVLLITLMLLFSFPLSMIRGLINERQENSEAVEEEISKLHGGSQTVRGPLLVIKYREKNRDQYAVFTPDKLNIQTEMTTEIRKRGIYRVPTYIIDNKIEGTFSYPEFDKLEIDPKTVIWGQSYICADINNTEALARNTVINWNGDRLKMEAGSSKTGIARYSLDCILPEMKMGTEYKFSYDLILNGGKTLMYTPLAEETDVFLDSDWLDPSFKGFCLPMSKDENTEGRYKSEWHVIASAGKIPGSWQKNEIFINKIENTEFGLDLYTPINYYLLSERSVKYGLLFIFLPFLCFFLFEVVWKLKIHFLQYLLVGAAESIFYLLLLSLSEQIGFNISFILSAFVTVVLITYYAYYFVKSWQKTAFLSAILSISFIFLFVIIHNEDYSLLGGSIGLFIILATVMITTRKIDWYKLGRR